MDDIEDFSTLRRGKPAAHIVFGIPMTVCSANYVLVKTILNIIDQVPEEKKINGTMIIMVCHNLINTTIQTFLI